MPNNLNIEQQHIDQLLGGFTTSLGGYQLVPIPHNPFIDSDETYIDEQNPFNDQPTPQQIERSMQAEAHILEDPSRGLSILPKETLENIKANKSNDVIVNPDVIVSKRIGDGLLKPSYGGGKFKIFTPNSDFAKRERLEEILRNMAESNQPKPPTLNDLVQKRDY